MNETTKQTEMGVTGEKKKEETTVTGKVMEMEKQMKWIKHQSFHQLH